MDAYRDRAAGIPIEDRAAMQEEREERELAVKEAKRKMRAEEERRRVRRVEPGGEKGRWEFRFRDVSVEEAGMDGRGRRGVGVRYGMPHEDRKKGIVKIPRRVE